MATITQVNLKTVSHVILYVPDTEKAIPFYRDTLGMSVNSSEPGWAEIDCGSLRLALHGYGEGAEHKPNLTTVVFSVEKVEEIVEALKQRGVAFEGDGVAKEVCGDDRMVGLSAEFKDPFGNLLSVFEYRAR